MKGLPHLRLSLSVVAILAVMLLAGGWSEPLDAAAPPGAYLRPVAPSAADSITLLAVADATVKSGFPNANFGGADTLDLEYASDGRTIARVLLRFDLAAGLPSGAVIDSAQLQVLLNSGTGVSPIAVRASTVTQGWAELGVTWDTAPSIGDPSADAQVGTTQGWVTWDVTAIAQGWQTGRNYGLELRGPEISADWYRTFRSRHPVEAEPRLVVTYSFQDTTPPSNPSSFTADHTVNQWSNDASISGHWDGASDGAGSGVYGYSIEWNGSQATVPDTVVDTTTNQDTHQLAEGSWYLHVRTRDVASNWNADASHFGPYKIDLTPPADPIVTSTTHTPLVWSSSSFVQVSWSGASDGAGSGVAGYSILWDGAPMTVPDMGVDTTGAAASTTRPDGTTHFHLRTKDFAGNWSGATHFGPLGIDTAAPGCTVVALPAYVGLAPFSVKWVSFDAGSGVASYDVQYRNDGGAWTNWHTGTTSNSASFTGDRGHTYTFRCRARDAVGNQGAYPATADTSTRVGRTLTIQIRYGGAPAAGAKVYRNGELLGTTDGGGNLAAPDCVQGDNLAAHHAIYNKPSLKRPADPSWVVYATNVTIPVTGAPQLFVFGDVGASSNPVMIDVDGNRPLIGFRVVFSVEWDAPADYLDDLRQGTLLASQYLYDVTDGQMFWEYVDIFDNRTGWDWTDYRVQLHNQTWPQGDVWGIVEANRVIWMSRVFGRGFFKTLSWTNWDAYPVLGHEFGHYGLGLWDEYLKRDSSGGGSCATHYTTQPQASRSSIMYHEWNSSELCSTVDPNHLHNTQTAHDALSGGESTWQTVLRRFADPATVDRWTLQSPVERGQIVPGPDALPGNWVKSNIVNYNTGACSAFDLWLTDGGGHPIMGALVWLDRPGIDLTQGVTDANGQITVYGAHNGETLSAQKDGASGSMPISCGAGPAVLAPAPALTIPPAPFALEVSASAAGQDRLDITVRASVTLAAPPAVEVQQVAGSEPQAVTMTFDAGSGVYRGQAVLPPAGGTQGYVRVAATDMAGHTVVRMTSFKLIPVPANESTTVGSAENVLRVTFPAGSLSGDTVVSIQETPQGAATQGELVRVGAAYAVMAASGQIALNAPAAVLMYYPVGLSNVVPGTLKLHRWDTAAGKWVAYDGTVDGALNLVSAQVSQLGTFAILGERTSRSLYLPLVLR